MPLEQQAGVFQDSHAATSEVVAGVSQRPARIPQEHVVQRGLREADRFQRDLLPIEQSEKLGQRGAAVLYVETQPAVLDANLPDERLGSQERACPFDEPVVDKAEHHRIADDLPLEFARGPLGDDRAVVHDRQPVTEGIRLFQIVRGQKDRRPALLDGPDVVPQIRPVLRIEAGGGLVEEQDLGLVNEPEGDVEAPALASRIGRDLPIGEFGEVEHRGELFRPLAHGVEIPSVEAALEDEVLPAGRHVVGATRLADVADPLTHLLRLARDVGAGHARRARVDGQQRREHPERRRLSGSVRSEEAEDLAPTDLEADALDRFDGSFPAAEALAKILRRDDCFHLHSPRSNGWSSCSGSKGGEYRGVLITQASPLALSALVPVGGVRPRSPDVG